MFFLFVSGKFLYTFHLPDELRSCECGTHETKPKHDNFQSRKLLFSIPRDNCQTRSSYLCYLRMCFVLKRAGSQCIEIVYAQWTSQVLTLHRIRYVLLFSNIQLGDWTLVLYSKRKVVGVGATVRRFAVYDATFIFFQ